MTSATTIKQLAGLARDRAEQHVIHSQRCPGYRALGETGEP